MTTNSKLKSAIVELKALLEDDEDRLRVLLQELLQELLEQETTKALAAAPSDARKTPPGRRIARWYCPESHTTFSLLPDCLAARLPGTLAELEDAVVTAERFPSLAAAAARLRSGRLEPPGAMRWLRRRIRLVGRALTAVRSLLPERFAGCSPATLAFRDRLGTDAALAWLREMAAPQLPSLPMPLGYARHTAAPGHRWKAFLAKSMPTRLIYLMVCLVVLITTFIQAFEAVGMKRGGPSHQINLVAPKRFASLVGQIDAVQFRDAKTRCLSFR